MTAESRSSPRPRCPLSVLMRAEMGDVGSPLQPAGLLPKGAAGLAEMRLERTEETGHPRQEGPAPPCLSPLLRSLVMLSVRNACPLFFLPQDGQHW